MPILALSVYLIGTYFPLVYKFMPFLGLIRIVLLAGIVLLISFLVTYKRYTNFTAYKNPIVYCWLVFFCFMTLGIFVSPDRGATLALIVQNLKHFLIFLVMIKIVDTPKRFGLVVLIFTLCGVGMGVSAIYNHYFGTEVLTGGYAVAEGDGSSRGYRAIALEGGIFGDPNDLALLLNTVLPFAVYFFLERKQKFLPLLGAVIIVIATMLTYSRAGFLGLCMTGLMFLLLFGKMQMKYVFLFLVLGILFWSVAPESYKERIETITAWKVDEKTGTTGTRMDSWKVALTEGLNHPILGMGAGSGEYVNGTLSKDWHMIHNAFVQVFVEIGMVGFIAYLLLYIIPFKQYKMVIRNLDDNVFKLSILHKVMIISFVSFGSTAFFTPQAYSPLLYMLTALAVIELELIMKESNSLSVSPTHFTEYQSPIRKLREAGS